MASFTTSNAAYAWTSPGAVTQAYALNGQNQYTSVGSAPYSYDLKGNLTTTSSGGAVYSYDSENRLISMSGSPGATLVYYPDGSLWQTVGSATTQFLYDGDTIIGEYSSPGALLRRYVPGPAIDEPLVWYEGSGLTSRRWLLADHQGSVIAWADTSGAIPAANINSYDEYGQPGPSNTGRFQYTGQAWIPEVAAYDYRARNYMPSIGRFMQTDPKGYDAGMNLYAYADDDPVDHTDPMGTSSCGRISDPDCRAAQEAQDEAVRQAERALKAAEQWMASNRANKPQSSAGSEFEARWKSSGAKSISAEGVSQYISAVQNQINVMKNSTNTINESRDPNFHGGTTVNGTQTWLGAEYFTKEALVRGWLIQGIAHEATHNYDPVHGTSPPGVGDLPGARGTAAYRSGLTVPIIIRIEGLEYYQSDY